MVRQTPATMEAARRPIAAAQFERARGFIDANLKSPHLSADLISASIGVSRRHLFYLFERHGGARAFFALSQA